MHIDASKLTKKYSKVVSLNNFPLPYTVSFLKLANKIE